MQSLRHMLSDATTTRLRSQGGRGKNCPFCITLVAAVARHFTALPATAVVVRDARLVVIDGASVVRCGSEHARASDKCIHA